MTDFTPSVSFAIATALPLLNCRGNVTRQADDTILRVDVNLQSADRRVGEHLRLHCSGNGGIASDLSCFASGVPRGVGDARCCCRTRGHDQDIDDVTHAIGRSGNLDRTILCRRALHFAPQRDNFVLRVDIDISSLDDVV